MSARRLYWRSFAAVAVLLPVALWTASGDSYFEYRKKQAVVETVADVGAAQEYGGSEWRIDRYDTWKGQLPAMQGARTISTQPTALPDGVSLVRVRVALRPKSGEAVKALLMCQLELVDAQGRRWTSQTVQTSVRREVPTSCNGSYNNEPQVAQEYRFEQDFLVPDDAANGVDAVIRLRAEQPRRLRLRLR